MREFINKLAFRSNDVKNRVQNILSYKKPKTLVVCILLVSSSLLGFSLISSATTPLEKTLIPDSDIQTTKITDNVKTNSSTLSILYEEYESLPDYSYDGDDIAKKIAINSALQRFDKYYKGQFNIADAHIFGVYEEKNKIKIFANINATGFILSDNIVYPQSGYSIPTAITCTKNEDGSYTVDKYEEPKDGSLYAPSIEKFCTMPVSGKRIVDLSKEMVNFSLHSTDKLDQLEINLKNHLTKHNKLGVSYLRYQYPKDTYINLT